MSTAIETLPSRHKVSWKGWVIALVAAGMLAAAFGTYMVLRSGGTSSPSVVQTVKPSVPTIPQTNFQPGAPANGPVIAELRDVGGVSGVVGQPTTGQEQQGKTGNADTSSSSSGDPSSNRLSTTRACPC